MMKLANNIIIYTFEAHRFARRVTLAFDALGQGESLPRQSLGAFQTECQAVIEMAEAHSPEVRDSIYSIVDGARLLIEAELAGNAASSFMERHAAISGRGETFQL